DTENPERPFDTFVRMFSATGNAGPVSSTFAASKGCAIKLSSFAKSTYPFSSGGYTRSSTERHELFRRRRRESNTPVKTYCKKLGVSWGVHCDLASGIAI